MTGFELPTSGVGSNHSINWATTKTQFPFCYDSKLSNDRSVTSQLKPLSVWPDMAKFHHLRKNFKVFGKFIYHLAKFKTYFWHFYALGINYIVVKGQKLKNNNGIWSHCPWSMNNGLTPKGAQTSVCQQKEESIVDAIEEHRLFSKLTLEHGKCVNSFIINQLGPVHALMIKRHFRSLRKIFVWLRLVHTSCQLLQLSQWTVTPLR